LQITDQAQS